MLGCWRGLLLPTREEPSLAQEAAQLAKLLQECGWKYPDPTLLQVSPEGRTGGAASYGHHDPRWAQERWDLLTTFLRRSCSVGPASLPPRTFRPLLLDCAQPSPSEPRNS